MLDHFVDTSRAEVSLPGAIKEMIISKPEQEFGYLISVFKDDCNVLDVQEQQDSQALGDMGAG